VVVLALVVLVLVLVLVPAVLVLVLVLSEMKYTHCKFCRVLPRYRVKGHSEGGICPIDAECTPRIVAHCSSAARRQKRSPQCCLKYLHQDFRRRSMCPVLE
jgi:hypothetical protein